MGCDIHIVAETRTPNGWQPVGEVFDSPYDFNFVVARPENLARLTDGQLVDAACLRVIDEDKELRGALKDCPEAVTACEAFARWCEEDKGAVEAAQAKVRAKRFGTEDPDPSDPEVQALAESTWEEDWEEADRLAKRLRRERRGAVELKPEVRAALERALCDFRYSGVEEEDEEDEDEYRMHLSLDRAEGEPPFKTGAPWTGRNYNLFAMLADVRNGRGFAGIPTGEGFEPISEPRGIPEDAHPETVKFMERMGVDGHSHTYFTLRELREYDWDQETVLFDVVSEEAYLKMRDTGEQPGPGAWTWADDVVTFTAEGYEDWVERGRPAIPSRPFGLAEPEVRPASGVLEAPGKGEAAEKVIARVRIEMREKYRDCAGPQWWETTLPALEALIPEGGSDEDVRICFFFDN